MRGWIPSVVKDSRHDPGDSFPSCVYVTKQNQVVVGYDAYKQRLRDPNRYKEQFKRDLGKQTPYLLGGCQLRPEDLVVEVIKKLKDEAERTIGQTLTRVVLAVPATHQKHKGRLMLEAAKAAGFNQVHLVKEPVAAAVYYAQRSSTKDKEVLLVYDLGGGTFDASLIQRKGSGYKFLAPPVGFARCGGIDFERRILEHVKKHCSADQIELFDPNRRDVQALRTRLNLADSCRVLKENLSTQEEDSFTLPFPGKLQEYRLTRSAFESMIAPYISETVELCQQMLANAGLEEGQIDQVILVGGSCKIPYVRKVWEQRLNRAVLQLDDPDLAVCKGAAIYEGWNPGYAPLQAGIDLEDVGDHQGAIAKYNEALEKSPNYARAYVERSAVYAQLGEHSAAIQDADRAIELEPAYADAYVKRADVDSRLGKELQAIGIYDQGLRFNPNLPLAYYDKGRCLKDLGNKKQAQDCWHEGLRAIPKTSADYAIRGTIRHELEQYDKALEEFEEALRLNNKNIVAYVHRAMAYSAMENNQAVRNNFDKALSLNSNHADIYGWRGVHFERTGELEKAIEEFDKALQINQKYMNVYIERGRCRSGLGDQQEAIEDFNRALAINPNNSYAYDALGYAYLYLGYVQEAEQKFKKALKLNPNNPLAHCGIGDYLSTKEEWQEAIFAYQEALCIEPKLAQAHDGLGQVFHNQGKLDDAIVAYKAALRIAPNFVTVHNQLGVALDAQGKLDEAVASYKEAIRLAPDFAMAHANLGRALLRQGQSTDGVANLKTAKKLFRTQGDNEEADEINILLRQYRT